MLQKIPKVQETQQMHFFTSIWIVPFIALLIAGWLSYQYFSARGPEIRIMFPKNEGLKAGQSQIKYRNVPIGKVTKIILEKEGVVVVARMDKEAAPYMNEYAKFWIVKPEVGISGISGLDTLLSGTYIDMYSEVGDSFKDTYRGRTHPYRVVSGGEYFALDVKHLTNIVAGTPVFYQNIKAGQVEHINLGLDNKSTHVVIFIDKKFVPYIHTDSQFWEKNLLNIDFSKGNIDMNIASFKHLLLGGIEFSSSREDKEDTVPEQHSFTLYSNNTQASNQSFQKEEILHTFLLKVGSSTSNLKIDASVQFDGFNIGKVIEIHPHYNQQQHKMLADVLIEINTKVFKDNKEQNITGEENLYKAVKEGLRAKLETIEPITGMLFVNLTFDHNQSHSIILNQEKTAPLFPMADTQINSVLVSMNKVLEKINNLALEDLLSSVTQSIEEVKTLIKDSKSPLIKTLNNLKNSTEKINQLTAKKEFQSIPLAIQKSLKAFESTLKTTKKTIKGYDSNALVMRQLSETLKVISFTSKELQVFLKLLNRKPNSLIFGDD